MMMMMMTSPTRYRLTDFTPFFKFMLTYAELCWRTKPAVK